MSFMRQNKVYSSKANEDGSIIAEVPIFQVIFVKVSMLWTHLYLVTSLGILGN